LMIEDAVSHHPQSSWITAKSSSPPQPKGTFSHVGSRHSVCLGRIRGRNFAAGSRSQWRKSSVCLLSVCFSWLIAERTPLLELSFSLKRYLWSLSSACLWLVFQFFFSMQITSVKTCSVTLRGSFS
jgi:hypothetical protein